MTYEKAIFAAGCFWGVEHSFRQLTGVSEVYSGYIGGHTENPTYKEVCRGDTEHAEAVEVTFDPSVISYDALLNHFWHMHDPTQKDRQGPDHGRQYRSAIFATNDEQLESAKASKDALSKSGRFSKQIETEIIAPGHTFYMAEDYHQKYIEKNGGGHCAL